MKGAGSTQSVLWIFPASRILWDQIPELISSQCPQPNAVLKIRIPAWGGAQWGFISDAEKRIFLKTLYFLPSPSLLAATDLVIYSNTTVKKMDGQKNHHKIIKVAQPSIALLLVDHPYSPAKSPKDCRKDHQDCLPSLNWYKPDQVLQQGGSSCKTAVEPFIGPGASSLT